MSNINHSELLLGTEEINLQNFGELRVSDAGELSVDPNFSKNIYLYLGRDLLELSRIVIEEPGDNLQIMDAEDGGRHRSPFTKVGMTPGKSVYALRNLSAEVPAEASMLLDPKLKEVAAIEVPEMGDVQLLTGNSITIGRAQDTTPELQLSPYASNYHAEIRFGGMRGNVHFTDLDSMNGTRVYLSSEDYRSVDIPRRTMLRDAAKGLILLSEAEHRWTR